LNVASLAGGRLAGLIRSRLAERFADRGEQIVFQLFRGGKVGIRHQRRVLLRLVIFAFPVLPTASAPLFQPLVVSCRGRRFDSGGKLRKLEAYAIPRRLPLPLRRIVPGKQGIVTECLTKCPQRLMTNPGSLLNRFRSFQGVRSLIA
jgi:hypothetical protein